MHLQHPSALPADRVSRQDGCNRIAGRVDGLLVKPVVVGGDRFLAPEAGEKCVSERGSSLPLDNSGDGGTDVLLFTKLEQLGLIEWCQLFELIPRQTFMASCEL